MKKEIATLDATPSKRLFLSIIADYDLNKSICELVDNGLDVWVRNGKKKAITISVNLDKNQQTIVIEDDAGGLARDELRYVVGPGQTGTKPTDETIGMFGVGTKRAVVALAQDIKIRTRHSSERLSFEVDFDDSWIENEDWELPLYEIDPIRAGTTAVELQRLRMHLTDEVIAQLREHLSATYAQFLTSDRVALNLNGKPVAPRYFDDWAYPPNYEPRRYKGTLRTEDGRNVKIEAVAGLAQESSPASGEYGVYFYCNNRLVARALKTFEVGFTRGLAGLPHPKVSLVRVILSISGDARDMPWNSSKSDINTNHHIFQAFHDWLVQVVKDYASLSRIWMGEWPDKVFKHATGTIEDVEIKDFPTAKKSFLPPLPKSRPRYGDIVASKNRSVANKKPWVKGLYEGIIAADLIAKQRLEQRNRIAFIVLDSTLEIGFKEYLVNESGKKYTDAKLGQIFNNRSDVHQEIRSCISLPVATWNKIDHFYRLRCKFVHERATVGIADSDLRSFRTVVEAVLAKLFGLKFQK